MKEACRAAGRDDVGVVRARHDEYRGPRAANVTLRALRLGCQEVIPLVEPGGQVLFFREGAAGHPILTGVDVAELKGCSSLYQVRPLAKTAIALLIGSIEGKPTEPVAWVNRSKFGGRVFYTSLGHRDDFKQSAFNQLLRNAITWAVGRPAGKTTTGR